MNSLVFSSSREAQKNWACQTFSKQINCFKKLRENILSHREELTSTISHENGKPKLEALIHDVYPVLETISYLLSNLKRLKEPKKIPLSNPTLIHRRSTLHPQPLGSVLIISPWNFPFFLPLSDILFNLAAGNSVVLKPSEWVPKTSRLIANLIESSFPIPGLFQLCIGDGHVGSKLIDLKPDKIFFTGSVSTGRKIAIQAAHNLTPCSLELGGKDAMIILPDACLDFATSAALWGAMANSGQLCASTERLLVPEEKKEAIIKLLKEKMSKLTYETDQTFGDLGTTTTPLQLDIYSHQLEEAKLNQAKLIPSYELNREKKRLRPVLVDGPEHLSVYKEETFGPVLAISTYRSTEEAIEKANDSNFGLLASIIGKDLKKARQIALQIQAGSVLINEVAYSASIPETPWGGIKQSGLGVRHSEQGFLACVHLKHIHAPISRFLSFKSPWWFPYSKTQVNLFSALLDTHSILPRVRILAWIRFILRLMNQWVYRPRL